jgi:nucleoside-diphosphate-sugar epimerase
MNILVIGASGNLGSHLARHLIKGPHQLRLLVHKTILPLDIANALSASQVQADLNIPSSLHEACKNIHCIVYFMSKGLFAVWRKPTWVHLLALPDFVRIVEIGIEKDNLSGIYNLCDDQPITLQEFLDEIARHWGFKKPRRLPCFSFYLAAMLCETFATIFRTGTPLTRDIVAMGMTSVVADTTRMKNEIVSDLMFPTLRDGLTII